MKNFTINFRVPRVLLAFALVPAALATAPIAAADVSATLQIAERSAGQSRPATPSVVLVPLAPKQVINPGIASLVEAAEKGHGPAQRELGALYDRGAPGTPRDFAESMRWYQKAREQGEEIPTPHTIRPIP